MDEEEIKRRVIFGDDVGYGKPPRHSQFQKGQSGNPKGRPTKAEPILTLTDQPMLSVVLAIANKMVPVRDGGEIRKMSMLEAVVTATATGAAKGNSRSQENFINLAQKAHAAEIQDRRRSIEIWTEIKRTRSAQFAEAARRGEPVPSILPHPDDIVIDYANGPRFLGPVIEQEQTMLDHTLRLRDVLVLQGSLDRRSTRQLDGKPVTEPGGAELFAMVLENFVPPRLRLSNTEWVWRTIKADEIPKRALLKRLFEDWRNLGAPLPRGFVFPGMTWVAKRIANRIETAKEIQSLPNPDQLPHGEWERAAAKIIKASFDSE